METQEDRTPQRRRALRHQPLNALGGTVFSDASLQPEQRGCQHPHFAFCSNLAEVSHLFDRYGIAEGVARLETGYACTDYGQALRDFAGLYCACLTDRTTVIILGDARNNFGNPEAVILKMIGQRAKCVVWLNPEVPSFWGTGDSAMKQYLPFCHGVRECKTLFHLERAIDSLLA